MTTAIRVQNLSKLYHIGALQHGPKSLKAALAENLAQPVRRLQKLLRRPPLNGNGGPNGEAAADTIWALKDISFEVLPGEVVGILGSNGSGKSTLMKVLSRVTVPTSGRVEVRGRVGSLLEVGTGFDPEFTGRENIYLSGPILGMSRKEIDEKFDQIVAFAEIQKFLDTPVKHYSSGMQMRLGFAVAAHLDPEILLVDEALSVGDTVFQAKCLARMAELAQSGRTVLFVSHDTGLVSSLCTRAIILNQGRKQLEGPTASVVKEYTVTLLSNGFAGQATESDAGGHALDQRLHDLLETPAEELPVEPLAHEVASSLMNHLPGMLVEELARRLGPSLAGCMSEYLAPSSRKSAGVKRSAVREPDVAATPPAANGAASEISLIVSPPRETEGASGAPAVFQLKNWDNSYTGYPDYLAEANKHRMDVNDWLDEHLGWGNCRLLVRHTLRPWLAETARVCELGAGSGRWARHVAPHIKGGELHLLETDAWLVKFLGKYFAAQRHVQSHLLSGCVLPFQDGSLDLMYSFDVFSSYALGKVDVFAREFMRVLRPGGRCVIQYLDISAPLTWEFLRNYGTSPPTYADSFSYHAPEAVDRVFRSAGLHVERRRHLQDLCEGFPMTALVAVRGS